jgi:hypothetical protein
VWNRCLGLDLCRFGNANAAVGHDFAQEREVTRMRKKKGRRKVGRKKRRMRAKIRHRK